MNGFLDYLLGSATFIPHGYCLLWRPDLVAMHLVSDVVIAVSYLSIPFAIAVFLRRRRDLHYSHVFWMFAAFIVACGMTHIAGAATLWVPAYGAQGLIKVATALVSAVTAIYLWPVIPKALALPSPAQLRAANVALEERIHENERINGELVAMRAELEAKVAARTAELAEAMQRLAEREQYFRTLYRTTPVMMHSVDRSGRLIEVNDHWVDQLGYEREEVIGRLARSFVAAAQQHELATETAPAFWASGACHRLRQTLVRKDGSTMEAEISAITEPGGTGDTAFAVVVDVTEREAAEARLREKARDLERANVGLSQFAYVASHDLQEPLRKITTFAGVLEDAIEKKDEADVRYAASVMQESAGRARRLVADLLRFSRSANAELSFMTVDLAAAVDTVLEDMSEAIEGSGADVRTDVDGIVVRADQTQLMQLIQNLVSNALKYHKPDEAPKVSISARRREGAIEVEVADDGIGFESSYADRIFEPFKRLHTQARYPGSGIGLAICRSIADQHGWSISARSQEGRGAVFTVRMPVREAGERS